VCDRSECNRDYPIKHGKMGAACDMYGGQTNTRTDFGGNIKDRDWVANLAVDGVIILKYTLKK
jgi:hypothetical protein